MANDPSDPAFTAAFAATHTHQRQVDTELANWSRIEQKIAKAYQYYETYAYTQAVSTAKAALHLYKHHGVNTYHQGIELINLCRVVKACCDADSTIDNSVLTSYIEKAMSLLRRAHTTWDILMAAFDLMINEPLEVRWPHPILEESSYDLLAEKS